MHTLAIECSDQAYEHILYFLKNLPKDDVPKILTDDNTPNVKTRDAIARLESDDPSVETYTDKDELFKALDL